jgi:hypothetical protein
MDAAHADAAIARAAAIRGSAARATASTFAEAAANEGLGGVSSRALATWRSETATSNTSRAPMKTETQASTDLSHIAQMIDGIHFERDLIIRPILLSLHRGADLAKYANGRRWFKVSGLTELAADRALGYSSFMASA